MPQENMTAIATILEAVKNHQLSVDEGYSQIQVLKNAERAKENDQPILYYKGIWQKKILNDGGNLPGDIIIFDNTEAVCTAWKPYAERLILVKPGECFRNTGGLTYEINPVSPADYKSLFMALEKQEINADKILHLWSKGAFTADKEQIDRQLIMSFYSMFYITQALMESGKGKTVRLLYVNEECENPLYAAICSFARTIRSENSKYLYKAIQLCDGTSEATAVQLMHEFSDESDSDPEVRFMNGIRQVKRQQEFQLSVSEDDRKAAFRENGVYVITGGAGRIGFICAQFICKQVKARIVLSGRTEMNTNIQNCLDALKTAGSQAIYVQADVSLQADAEKSSR